MGALMNPLQRALIEKTGHDNGFEHVLPAAGDTVTLASAHHRSHAVVTPFAGDFEVRFQPASPALVPELLRSFKLWARADGVFRVPTLADLAALLRRAASLSQALPNQAVRDCSGIEYVCWASRLNPWAGSVCRLGPPPGLPGLTAEIGGGDLNPLVSQFTADGLASTAVFYELRWTQPLD